MISLFMRHELKHHKVPECPHICQYRAQKNHPLSIFVTSRLYFFRPEFLSLMKHSRGTVVPAKQLRQRASERGNTTQTTALLMQRWQIHAGHCVLSPSISSLNFDFSKKNREENREEHKIKSIRLLTSDSFLIFCRDALGL